MRSVNYIVVVTIVFLLNSVSAIGQEKLSLDKMWEISLEQNPELQNARMNIDMALKRKKASWDPGHTSVELQRGQINSALIDNQFNIEQELGSPFEMAAASRYYQSEVGLYSEFYDKTQRTIKRSLRQVYYEWLYENQREKIILRALELYDKASQFVQIQYETGETSLLSKSLIESKWQEMSLIAERIRVNKMNLINQINVIINRESQAQPEEDTLSRLVVIDPNLSESFQIDSVPEVSIERQRLELSQRYLGLTRSKISPYFSAGYFNQELDQVSGFDGWKVKIAFPLWFFPQKSRIQAASINMSINENNYIYRKNVLENRYTNMINRYNQLEKNLQFYEDQRLENARLISDNANILFESGEIGYLEYTQNMSSAIQIQEDYWRLVNEYNQLVIDFYYYLDL